jgi:hypothetical protein
MPSLTRWYLKSALVWLVAALMAWTLLALRPLLGLPAALSALSPVAVHLLMVGWVTQLIFGIVFWMFPKPAPARAEWHRRVGMLTWLCLNAGLLARALGEPALALGGGAAAGFLVAVAAVLQLGAGWLFVATTWPRVRVR